MSSKTRQGPTFDVVDEGWSLVPAAPEPSVPPALRSGAPVGSPPVVLSLSPAAGPASVSDRVASFDGRVLRLRGTLDIYQAAKLQLELMSIASTPPEDLVVDVSELERIDAAAAQVLLAFRREVPRAVIVAPPDAVRERLERVGVWQAL